LKYGSVPGIEKPVARIVQGPVMIRSEEEGEEERSFVLLDEVFARGGTTFDTAHQYGGGDCERTFGRWVRERGLREEVVVIGKGAHHNEDRKRVTPFDITADLYDSLARLGSDYIDLYLAPPRQPIRPRRPHRRGTERAQKGRQDPRLRRFELEARAPTRSERLRKRVRPYALRREQSQLEPRRTGRGALVRLREHQRG